jgi:MFS superfamily sulfate permease-like transporter
LAGIAAGSAVARLGLEVVTTVVRAAGQRYDAVERDAETAAPGTVTEAPGYANGPWSALSAAFAAIAVVLARIYADAVAANIPTRTDVTVGAAAGVSCLRVHALATATVFTGAANVSARAAIFGVRSQVLADTVAIGIVVSNLSATVVLSAEADARTAVASNTVRDSYTPFCNLFRDTFIALWVKPTTLFTVAAAFR